MRRAARLSGFLSLCVAAPAGRPLLAITAANMLLIVSGDHAWTDYGFMVYPVVSEAVLRLVGAVPAARAAHATGPPTGWVSSQSSTTRWTIRGRRRTGRESVPKW